VTVEAIPIDRFPVEGQLIAPARSQPRSGSHAEGVINVGSRYSGIGELGAVTPKIAAPIEGPEHALHLLEDLAIVRISIEEAQKLVKLPNRSRAR
jgi:hypothetical protein